MNRKYLLGCVCAALSLIFVFAALKRDGSPPWQSPPAAPTVPYIQQAPGEAAETGSAPEPEPYESPIDFPALQAANSDIYAWLYIPDTDISYPILQREGDDTFYLTHGSDQSLAPQGALFTESTYNCRDCSDPVTVIYGHRMQAGTMFGQLQELYSDPDTFETKNMIVLYCTDQELHYAAFAAVPYDKRHILYNYNFQSARMSQAFFDDIFSIRAIGANFTQGVSVTSEDHVLILSTCLNGNRNKRYLVLAKLWETIGSTQQN